MILLVCSWCGNSFEKPIRYYKGKKRLGQETFFCCRSHQVSNQQVKRWQNKP